MDTILRKARVNDDPAAPLVDIGIGRRKHRCDSAGPSGRRCGDRRWRRLVSPGFVETHIHLDKSCILDRLTSRRGGLNEAIGEVAGSRPSGRPTTFISGPNVRWKSASPRHYPDADPPRGRPGNRASQPWKASCRWLRSSAGPWTSSLHLPAGGVAEQSRHRRAHG